MIREIKNTRLPSRACRSFSLVSKRNSHKLPWTSLIRGTSWRSAFASSGLSESARLHSFNSTWSIIDRIWILKMVFRWFRTSRRCSSFIRTSTLSMLRYGTLSARKSTTISTFILSPTCRASMESFSSLRHLISTMHPLWILRLPNKTSPRVWNCLATLALLQYVCSSIESKTASSVSTSWSRLRLNFKRFTQKYLAE